MGIKCLGCALQTNCAKFALSLCEQPLLKVFNVPLVRSELVGKVRKNSLIITPVIRVGKNSEGGECHLMIYCDKCFEESRNLSVLKR